MVSVPSVVEERTPSGEAHAVRDRELRVRIPDTGRTTLSLGPWRSSWQSARSLRKMPEANAPWETAQFPERVATGVGRGRRGSPGAARGRAGGGGQDC